MSKTIIISGGSEGLGYAIAKLLSDKDNVYILSRTEDKLKEVSAELGCKYKVCDVSKWEQVESAVNEILKETGSIDICINNAGLWIQGPLDENDPADIKDVLEVNTLGTIYLSRSVINSMKEKGSGTIINVNSQAGYYPKAERTVYNASKWAITGFTKSLFQELTKHGIRVVGFYPGKMDTGMFKKAGIDKDMKGSVDTLDAANAIEYIINQKKDIVIPELGMMRIDY